MIELSLTLAGILLVATMLYAYRRYRDPMHPLMLLSPMLLYVYVLLPANLHSRGVLTQFLGGYEGVDVAVGYSTAAAAMIALGCLYQRLPKSSRRELATIPQDLPPLARRRMIFASRIFGFGGLLVFLYQLELAGGFFAAYSRPKGGPASLGIGYVSEAPLLTIPAIILYLMARGSRRIGPLNWITLLLYASPHLIQGVFGGRRGPAFLGFGSLLFGWYLIRWRRATFKTLLPGLAAIGILLLFLVNYRHVLYFGSTQTFEPRQFLEIILSPSEEESGDTVYMLGAIKATWFYDAYQWGRGYITQIFIRPFPRVLWPSKYEFMNMAWMEDSPGSAGLSPLEWIYAVGWEPQAGSAHGLAGDTFIQFSWGGLALCWLVGSIYGWLWKNSTLRGGIWNIIYFEACVLSIYLPVQGLVSAWGYRLLYMSGATILLWRYLTRRGVIARPHTAPAITPRAVRTPSNPAWK